MNFIQKTLLKVAGIDNNVIKAVNASIQRFNGGSYFGTYSTYGPLQNKNYMEEYRNWVYACINARATDVSSIKLFVTKDGKKVDKSDIIKLLTAVNPTTTKQKLFYDTQAFLDLNGNAFWYLARDGKDGKGTIKEIYVLSPERVSIVLDKTNPLIIIGYMFKGTQGQNIPFATTEILHFKNFNPKAMHPYPHKGMGVVEAAAYAIDTDNQARTYNLNFFKNGARPEGVLMTDGEGVSDNATHKRLLSEWEEEYQGADNAHKIAILEGGLKYQQISTSSAEMEFLAGRSFNRDEILAMFRTPKSILGIVEDVNRANAEASNYVFALRTIKPLMQFIVDTINEFLLPEFDDSGTMEVDFVSPVPEDLAAMTAYFTAGYNKWLSRNDIRIAQGLEPTDKGFEMYYDSLTNVDLDPDVAPEPTVNKAIPADTVKKEEVKGGKVDIVKIVDDLKETQKSNKSSVAETVKKFVASLPKTKSETAKETHKGIMDDETKTAHIAEYMKRMGETAPFIKDTKAYFASQEKEVQKNLKNALKGLKPAEYRLKAIEADDLYDVDYAISSAISFVTPYITKWLNEGGAAGNTAAHGDGFNSSDTTVTDFIPTRAKFFATSINETTTEDLLNSIQDGIANSETLDQISQRVADVYDIAKGSRTQMIARTEVAAASNFGSIQAYKQAGVTEQQWAVVDPEDDDCLENDGVVVTIGDAFPSGDTEPPVHPNCQCTTLPVFDDSNEEE